jgi:hypothetical protein
MEFNAQRDPAERPGSRGSFACIVFVTLLCGAVLSQTEYVRRTASVTADETYYLSIALRSLQQGQLDPHLIQTGVAPVPIALNYLTVLGTPSKEPRDDPWKGRTGDRNLIYAPRLQTTLTTLVPVVVLAFGWLAARHGLVAGGVGAGLLTFSPTMLAHGSLATQDSAFAFQATLGLLCMGWYLATPARIRLVMVAGATTLAIGSKYTGILLIPCFLMGLAGRAIIDVRGAQEGLRFAGLRSGLRAVARGVTYVLLVGLLTWAVHGFEVTEDRLLGGLREPGFIAAIRTQINHNRFGHPSFLWGVRSTKGWWYYHPFTVLLKSTIPELIVFASVFVALGIEAVRAISALLGTARTRELPALTGDPYRLMMLLFCAALSAALIQSHINIGHRYTIALYPIAVLLATDAWAKWARVRGGLLRMAGLLVLCSQILSSVTAAPHYLAYFNPLAGGSERGWSYLADSNVDWGQDLPSLEAIIDQAGYRRVAIDYFGSASLADYGIRADSPDAWKNSPSDYDAFAVSVTMLHSVYPRGPRGGRELRDNDCYRDLRRCPPTHRAGHSIFVYDLRDASLRHEFLASASRLEVELAGSRPMVRTAAGEPVRESIRRK